MSVLDEERNNGLQSQHAAPKLNGIPAIREDSYAMKEGASAEGAAADGHNGADKSVIEAQKNAMIRLGMRHRDSMKEIHRAMKGVEMGTTQYESLLLKKLAEFKLSDAFTAALYDSD